MARTVEVENRGGTREGYTPLTPEQIQALDAAGQRLAFETRDMVKGDTIELPCRITVGDVEMYAKTFNGVTQEPKPCRRITATLTGQFEPLDFETMSGDNVQNNKTLLHKLYVAVKREVPPERGRFSYDLDDLEVDTLLVVLEKGNKRTDGRRGGSFFNIKGFKRPRAASASGETYEQYTARMAAEQAAATANGGGSEGDKPW